MFLIINQKYRLEPWLEGYHGVGLNLIERQDYFTNNILLR